MCAFGIWKALVCISVTEEIFKQMVTVLIRPPKREINQSSERGQIHTLGKPHDNEKQLTKTSPVNRYARENKGSTRGGWEEKKKNVKKL